MTFLDLKTHSYSIEFHHISRPTNSDTEHTTLNQNADAVSRLHPTTIHKSSEYGSSYSVEAATNTYHKLTAACAESKT